MDPRGGRQRCYAPRMDDRPATGVSCGRCGRTLPDSENGPVDQRRPCPDCRSLARRFERTMAEAISIRDSLATKLIRGATGEVAQEQFVGADHTKADGSWTEKTVLVDHETDRYVERVVRERDGAIVRDVDEPLSAHTGRGSDRPDLRAAREAARRQKAEQLTARKAIRDEERRKQQSG